MKTTALTSLAGAFVFAFALQASAATPAASEPDHAAHHPAGAASAASAPKAPATKAPAAKPKASASVSGAAMDKQMQAMQEMHEKMMAAKTPAERQALMADHMKVMHGGMTMMADAKDMQKRMDMMQSMMQMMMDRMDAMPAK